MGWLQQFEHNISYITLFFIIWQEYDIASFITTASCGVVWFLPTLQLVYNNGKERGDNEWFSKILNKKMQS